jgi:hypothetical protein
MRKLVLVTLLSAGLIQGNAGCIISTDDDDDDDDDGIPSDDGDDSSGECGVDPDGIVYTPTWTCPDDAETVEVFFWPEGSDQPLQPDTFECDDEPIICFNPGSYTVEVVPGNGADSFASLTEEFSGVDGDDIEQHFEFTNDGGFFQLAWTLDGVAAEENCAEGEVVEVIATLEGKDLKLSDSAPCEDGSATFPEDPAGWPLGTYELDIALLDAKGMPQSMPLVLDEDLLFGDELRDLGTEDISLVKE